jgi:predicted negative regulator of RcsB-dependent stress response
MPKKIKKRSKKKDEEVLDQEEVGTESEGEEGLGFDGEEMDEVAGFGDMLVDIPEHERDTFQEINYQAANWIEENRTAAMGIFFAVVLLPFGIYGAYYANQQSQVSDSMEVSAAMDAYRFPVKDSPQMQIFEQNDDLKKPKTIYDSRQAKWDAVYKKADEGLKAHSQGDLAVTAQLSKAAAAYQLGKYDEAVSLYEKVISDKRAESLRPFATLAMAMSQAGKGDVDAAGATFDKLAGYDEEYKQLAQYHKGRVLESAGKVDAAKEVYHKLLEESPTTTYKSDVERRLATL